MAHITARGLAEKVNMFWRNCSSVHDSYCALPREITTEVAQRFLRQLRKYNTHKRTGVSSPQSVSKPQGKGEIGFIVLDLLQVCKVVKALKLSKCGRCSDEVMESICLSIDDR